MLEDKKIAILLEELYDEFEYWYPKLRLEEEGVKVVTVAPEKKEYRGKKGFPARADADVKSVSPEDFDGVLIPGGYCPDRLRRFPEILNFVKRIYENGKLVATICHGGWVLISAGITRGKKLTGYFAIKDDLVNSGAEFIDAQVVKDGNLITSRHPGDLPYYMKAIIAFLKGVNVEKD